MKVSCPGWDIEFNCKSYPLEESPRVAGPHLGRYDPNTDRVVFNIKGNDYRMVAAIDYRRQIVFIKWIGSHSNYDKIDVRAVKYET